MASAVRFMVVCTCVNALEVQASGRSEFGWKNKLFQQKEFHRESPHTLHSHYLREPSVSRLVEPHDSRARLCG